MIIKEMADGRFVGIAAIEITSFPAFSSYPEQPEMVFLQNREAFLRLIREFHRLSVQKTACIELLWITEKAKDQVFKSGIRAFITIRCISKTRNATEEEIRFIAESMIPLLHSRSYQFKQEKHSELSMLLDSISPGCVFSVIKSEQISGNIYSPYPYYSCAVLPEQNSDNFDHLMTTLSQTENCCIALQLFPTQFTGRELSFINEQVAVLNRLSHGFFSGRDYMQDISAAEPQKVLSYYLSKARSPLFQYNILVFGDRFSCSLLSSRIVSVLQAGKDTIGTASCICTDLSREKISLADDLLYPWNINNKLVYTYRNTKLINTFVNIAVLNRLPYIVSAEEAVSFFRLPIRSENMPAIKENLIGIASEQFDESVTRKDNIVFGALAANNSIAIGCVEKGFTKHMLVVGTPGSGKTTFSINLLLQFAERGIPFLAVEPTKCEYRAMIDAVPDLQIFTPGNNTVAPFIINPFIPPAGIQVEQYIPSLTSAFEAAFSMPSPLDILFLRAVRVCYMEHGWKDYSKNGDPDVKSFGLREFIITFRKIIRTSQYSPEVKGNLESGGIFRLMNLIEQNSNIYDTVQTIPIDDLLHKPTVIELNAIENIEQKALIMALLLINICIYTKNIQLGDGKLKNIFLLDEAHVLLSPSSRPSDMDADSQGATARAIQNMIAEIRSYGTGIIIADQSPTKVSREVVANTDIKVSFRLVQAAEKQLISDSCGMDEQAEQNLSRLRVGEAYVYYSLLDSAQRIVTEDIREKKGIRLSVSNEEISKRMHYWDTKAALLRPYRECGFCTLCEKTCDFRIRSQADYYAAKLFEKNRTLLNDKKAVLRYLSQFEKMMQFVVKEKPKEYRDRLISCTQIKFIKKMEMDEALSFTEAEIRGIMGGK